MANTNNQNSFLDYSGLALFWNNVKNVIEDNELVTATALTDLDTRVDTLEKAATGQIISKPYLERAATVFFTNSKQDSKCKMEKKEETEKVEKEEVIDKFEYFIVV